jgi:outer membrane lipoprotein-sorting protein
MKRLITLALCSVAFWPAWPSATPRVSASDDLWARVRTTYADLRSYADTGEIAIEYGVSSTDRHTFTTAFARAPRHFLLDFRKQGGDRYVIWADPDAFHTWWKTTGQQSDYANPNNAPAISQSGHNTASAALKIPTLLYSKTTLGGDFVNFTDPTPDGSETVGGHRCYRLLGTTRDVYAATGKEVNVRKLTLWIDADTLLIRKVLEEAKPLPGQRSRIITTYEPRANVSIADSTFRFVPPGT